MLICLYLTEWTVGTLFIIDREYEKTGNKCISAVLASLLFLGVVHVAGAISGERNDEERISPIDGNLWEETGSTACTLYFCGRHIEFYVTL